ncbi:hypothetical protein OHC33_003853 [Knufia fluminis]|uniref:Zn(2)-C6 fungal-type domain-containing protein n=1 Tax=Knufia fluminis TaxID=191047 RepID=A0AAN8EGQ1_9EURO|nr:hypothetical protein OHC33_003853 [Knufia fluminis]
MSPSGSALDLVENEDLALDAWWSIPSSHSVGAGHGILADPLGFNLSDLDPFPIYTGETLGFEEGGQPHAKRRRERKIKCDERRPVCNNCRRSRRYSCRGYIDPLANRNLEVHNVPGSLSHTTTAGTETLTRVARRRHQAHHDTEAGIGTDDAGRAQPSYVPTENDEAHQDPRTPHVDNGAPFGSRPLTDGYHGLPSLSESFTDPSINDPVQLASEPGRQDDDLLLHYQKVVCHIMMPTIDALRNPWLQIYLPLACVDPPTTGQLALRHALMSVAAHHLALTALDPQHNNAMRASRHREEAKRCLTEILQSDSTENARSHKYALLATAMTLISIDVFSTDRGDCNISLNLARQVIQRTGGEEFWKSDARSSVLYQIFCCYEMVAITTEVRSQSITSTEVTSHSDEVSAHRGDNDVPNARAEIFEATGIGDSVPYTDYYALDTSFGISLRTISLLHRTIRAGAELTKAKSPSVMSHGLIQVIDEIKTKLYDIEKHPSAFSPSSSSHVVAPRMFVDEDGLSMPKLQMMNPNQTLPQVISDELIENHQWAFHYAVILYFHRVIPISVRKPSDATRRTMNNSDNACDANRNPSGNFPVPDHQRLVCKVLDRLENIDCLTRDTEIRPASTLWPAFIAAVEAVNVDLRHRALIWFSKAAQKGIGNIPRAKELVMEIWRRVDRQLASNDSLLSLNHGLGPVDWRLVMEELGQSIMLT